MPYSVFHNNLMEFHIFASILWLWNLRLREVKIPAWKWWSVDLNEGHPIALSALWSFLFQVDGVTTDWHTPLFNACVSGSQDCVKLLLEYGASPHPACDLASPIHEAAKRGKLVENLFSHQPFKGPHC